MLLSVIKNTTRKREKDKAFKRFRTYAWNVSVKRKTQIDRHKRRHFLPTCVINPFIAGYSSHCAGPRSDPPWSLASSLRNRVTSVLHFIRISDLTLRWNKQNRAGNQKESTPPVWWGRFAKHINMAWKVLPTSGFIVRTTCFTTPSRRWPQERGQTGAALIGPHRCC